MPGDQETSFYVTLSVLRYRSSEDLNAPTWDVVLLPGVEDPQRGTGSVSVGLESGVTRRDHSEPTYRLLCILVQTKELEKQSWRKHLLDSRDVRRPSQCTSDSHRVPSVSSSFTSTGSPKDSEVSGSRGQEPGRYLRVYLPLLNPVVS